MSFVKITRNSPGGRSIGLIKKFLFTYLCLEKPKTWRTIIFKFDFFPCLSVYLWEAGLPGRPI